MKLQRRCTILVPVSTLHMVVAHRVNPSKEYALLSTVSGSSESSTSSSCSEVCVAEDLKVVKKEVQEEPTDFYGTEKLMDFNGKYESDFGLDYFQNLLADEMFDEDELPGVFDVGF
ncbi:hypothetical protein U1Q18_002232 [Sarracenia purpurea var. burkii]